MRIIGLAAPAAPLVRPQAPPWRSVLRRSRRHRRLGAALLLATAAGLAVRAAAPPLPPSAAVVASARDLPAGRILAAGDLRVVRVPAAAVPDGAATGTAAVTGRVLAGAVRRGEALTDARLVGPGVLAGALPGLMAVPLPVDGALPLGLVSPGVSVAVLAGAAGGGTRVDGAADDGVASDRAAGDGSGSGSGSGGTVLVRRARVLVAPVDASGAGGLLGSAGGGSSTGQVVVLALDADQAAAVTAEAADHPLTLALLP